LLVSGTLTLDTTRRRGEEFTRVPGGSALYASLAASLTLPIRVVGTVGSDFDLGALPHRHGWGIDSSAVEVIPGRTFEWSAEYSDDGDTRTTLARVPGVEAGRVPRVPLPATASDALLLASANPRVQSAVLAACPDVLNVGLDSMTHWWREEAEALRALLGRVQVLFLNEEELAAATRDGDPEELLALGPTMVVVKCGSHGAWLQQRGTTGRVRVPAVSAHVVDPTGAGDAFAGAFMAGFVQGMASDLAALLRHAALVSAFAVEGVGAAGLMEAAKPGVFEERRQRAGAGR
jgi:sugar/nucleoside kinase (ribokinase family)